MLGNSEGWRDGFKFKTLERGVATHIYAAFEPSLKGKDIPRVLFRVINADSILY